MLKSTRRKLFYALVALFLVLGSGVVFYAQGWRLNVTTWHFEKIGEIYVRSYPENATITLNGGPVQSGIGFISRGTLIPDLLPKTYTVALSATGFLPWRESATVSPSLVTEFKYAVLIPDAPTLTSTSTMTGFALTRDGVAVQTANGVTLLNVSTTTNPGIIASASSRIAPIIIRHASGNFFLPDPTATTTINLNHAFATTNLIVATTTALVLDPYAPDVVAMNPTHLAAFDPQNDAIVAEATTTARHPFTAVGAGPTLLAWSVFNTASDTSALWVADLNNPSASPSGGATLPGKTIQIQWIGNNSFGVLQNDGSLYRYPAGGTDVIKTADDVIMFAASDDGSTLAARENQSIEVFAPATSNYWRFNIPDPASVSQIFWYHDGEHLFVVYPDHVSLLDLTDATLTNFATVAQGISPYYDPVANALYILNPDHHLEQYDFSN